MRATSKLLALALTMALQPAFAGVVSLDFETEAQQNLGPFRIGDYYQSQGITFSGDAWYLTSNSRANGCKGSYSFSRSGSCGAMMLANDATGNAASTDSSFTLNFAGGFTKFSFLYSARSTTDIEFDFFDAKGSLLDSITGNDLTDNGCRAGSSLFCSWTQLDFQTSGVAASIRVTGLDQKLMLDNLSFTAATPDGRLPEPASIALALGALGAAALTRRRSGR